MSLTRAKILLVEDEPDIRSLMQLHLKREGFEVTEAPDGDEALRKIHQGGWSLYVFDWMLPGMSGIDLVRALREAKDRAPVLMVTAKVEPADIVLGLESGADDYVTKPFEVAVFLARVKALLRRSGNADQPAPSSGELRLGELRLKTLSHEVYSGSEQVHLTPSEFKLLEALLKNQDKVLTRNQLIDLVQGEGVSVVDRTVDTHVFGLRKKLGSCGELIETVRGVGYRVRTNA